MRVCFKQNDEQKSVYPPKEEVFNIHKNRTVRESESDLCVRFIRLQCS